ARGVDVSSDGLVFTMSKPAAASVTGAPVQFDNFRAFNAITAEPGSPFTLNKLPEGYVFDLPASAAFSVSGVLECFQNAGIQINGNGAQLFSPPGTPSIELTVSECKGARIRDLRLKGNMGKDGFG